MKDGQRTVAKAIRDVTRQLALAFVQSAQYGLRGRDNSQYVEDLYNGILRRGSDPVGFVYWVNLLNGGVYSRQQLVNLFVDSQEFQFRMDAVIAAGCNQ